MNGAAVVAGAQFLAGIKSLEQRRQVAHDALELDLDAVDDVAAIVAIPLKGIDQPVGPLAFDDQADAARDRALGRMRDARR